jgi:hypothetical protein
MARIKFSTSAKLCTSYLHLESDVANPYRSTLREIVFYRRPTQATSQANTTRFLCDFGGINTIIEDLLSGCCVSYLECDVWLLASDLWPMCSPRSHLLALSYVLTGCSTITLATVLQMVPGLAQKRCLRVIAQGGLSLIYNNGAKYYT